MLTTALRGCGLDPAFIVGGDLRDLGRGAAVGSGELLVVAGMSNLASQSIAQTLVQLLAPFTRVIKEDEPAAPPAAPEPAGAEPAPRKPLRIRRPATDAAVDGELAD